MRRETCLCFLIAAAAAVAPVVYGQNTPAPAPGGEVHGYVSAVFPTAAGDQEIALPGVRVFLRQAADDQIVAASGVVTNARGYFRTPLQPPGRYRVCGEAANFEPGCAEKDIEIGNQTVLLNPHLILKPVGKAVYGRITLKDGSPAARSITGLYTTAGAARVAMVNAQGQTVAGPVPANVSGYYVIPNVPPSPDLKVSITYESASEFTALAPDATRLDLGLHNTPPKIASMTATLGGKTVTQAPSGATVQVTVKATDADHDSLHYGWQDSSGTLKSQDAPTISWRLPTSLGVQTIYVEVRDGKGGVARASLSVVTTAAEAARGPARAFFLNSLPGGNIGAANFRLILPPALPTLAPPKHGGPFIDPTDSMPCNQEPDCEAETVNYYKAIGVFDASGNPTAGLGTLQAWRNTFGFSANPLQPVADEVRTVYFNNGDLRFGRDMHCREISGAASARIACYVTNFSNTGSPGGDPQLSIGLAQENASAIATVAMILTSGTPPLVNFFVYAGGGKPQVAAGLDGEGEKAVPGVCISCHGGRYDTGAHLARNSSFLPFDTPSFIESTTAEAILEPAQREGFRKMNAIVKDSTPTQTIQALIDGWYGWCGGVGATGCYIDDVAHPFVPGGACPAGGSPTCGWDQASVQGYTFDSRSFYLNVPKIYCRSCHAARPETFNIQNFSEFSSSAGLVHFAVCDGHKMPDAEVPYNRFWLDFPAQDAMSALLRAIKPGLTPCRQ